MINIIKKPHCTAMRLFSECSSDEGIRKKNGKDSVLLLVKNRILSEENCD